MLMMEIIQDYLANEIQTAFEKLTNQARFVQMIINKELMVSNRKKADIITDLRKHQFRPFPKVSIAKATGETEPTEEDEDEDEPDEIESQADFDYLLGMPIWSLTKEKVWFNLNDPFLYAVLMEIKKDCPSECASGREGG